MKSFRVRRRCGSQLLRLIATLFNVIGVGTLSRAVVVSAAQCVAADSRGISTCGYVMATPRTRTIPTRASCRDMSSPLDHPLGGSTTRTDTKRKADACVCAAEPISRTWTTNHVWRAVRPSVTTLRVVRPAFLGIMSEIHSGRLSGHVLLGLLPATRLLSAPFRG